MHACIDCTTFDHSVGSTSSRTKLGPGPLLKIAAINVNASSSVKRIAITVLNLAENSLAFSNSSILARGGCGIAALINSAYYLPEASMLCTTGAKVTLLFEFFPSLNDEDSSNSDGRFNIDRTLVSFVGARGSLILTEGSNSSCSSSILLRSHGWFLLPSLPFVVAFVERQEILLCFSNDHELHHHNHAEKRPLLHRKLYDNCRNATALTR